MHSTGPVIAPSLLTLPLEIRLQVYKLLFDNDDIVVEMTTANISGTTTPEFDAKRPRVVRHPEIFWSNELMFAEAPNTGLLRVNRQIHSEAIPILYSVGFSFTDAYTLQQFLETIGPGVKHVDYLRLSPDDLISDSIRITIPGLKLCENLTQFHVDHASICPGVGASASTVVDEMAPLLDVLAAAFVKNNLKKTIASLIYIEWPRCNDCPDGRQCYEFWCGCNCVRAKQGAEAINIEIGELIAKKYGVKYKHDPYWWREAEYWTFKEWYAEIQGRKETQALESMRVLFQDKGLGCSCSSPICRAERGEL